MHPSGGLSDQLIIAPLSAKRVDHAWVPKLPIVNGMCYRAPLWYRILGVWTSI